MEGVPQADIIFDAVFFVVLTSIVLQGTTVDPFARLFGATVDAPPVVPSPLEAGAPLPDGTSLREVEVPAGSFGDERAVMELHLPDRALLVLVSRDGTYIVPTGGTRLRGGDVVLFLASDDVYQRVGTLLTAPAENQESEPS